MARSFGLILAHRAVVLGAVKVPDLIDLTTQAERSGFFDAVWAGDSLLAKPRLESVTLLSALAGVTTKLRLGVGCMATFVHRHPVMLAHQWASLDVLSAGRTLLAVCLGGPSEANAAQAAEHEVMSIASVERVGRLEEGIAVLRKLFGGKNASHQGRFYSFTNVTLEPRPVQQPCPIWIASNPTGLTWKGGASASEAVIERSFRRIARHADGWMTNKLTPDEFRRQWSRIGAMAREEGRDPAKLGKRGSKRPRPSWTRTTRRSSPASSSSSGPSRAAPSSAPRSSARISMPASATWRCASAPGTRWASSSASSAR